MARNSGSNVLGWLSLVMVTIAGGAALGYYVIAGTHPGRSTGTPLGVQEAAAPPPTPAPEQTKRTLVHVRPNSDYTAPGAPRIQIVENRTPTLGSPSPLHTPASSDTKTTMDNIPTPDAEASQQAPPDSSTPTSPDTSDSPVTPSSATTTSPVPNTKASLAPSQSDTATSDSEASQAAAPPTSSSATSDAHTLYRIQAGSFSKAQDAQTYLNTLQSKGVSASLSTERQGGQTMYHVQVGAYHDQAAAEQAATGFRNQGVPVTITPNSP